LILELCAYNIQSCIIAENAGAGRIELCGNPLEGGTTPSYGLIRYAVEQLSIPVFPMIRPRGGNFIYSESEFAIMKADIATCKELGCTGIATGAQLADLTLDVAMMSRMVEWAYPMQVTCHKVFDRVPDAHAALHELLQTGCSRVLTSGLQKTAIAGASLLKELGEEANGKIIIMPGGGVRSDNILGLAAKTNAREFHSSGIISISQSQMADASEVATMVRILNGLNS
jgi:copper homeostasis protein